MQDDPGQEEKAIPKANDQRQAAAPPAAEFGGRGGLDPTRYKDYEVNGKCVDF